MPWTMGRVVGLAGGSEEDLFFPRERMKLYHLPLQNTTQETRKLSGNLVLGGEDARQPETSASGHSPAAGSVRSTRPTRLHGSASRSALPTQTRSRGWDGGGGLDGRVGSHLLRALSAPCGRTALPSRLATRRGHRGRRCCFCCCRPGRAADARGGGGRQRAALPTLPF